MNYISCHTGKNQSAHLIHLCIFWKYCAIYSCGMASCKLNLSSIAIYFQIRPFMKAHLNRDKDMELLKLSQYLKEIGKLEDFTELNHKYWER